MGASYIPNDQVIYFTRHVLVSFNTVMVVLAIILAIYAIKIDPIENDYHFLHESPAVDFTFWMTLSTLLLFIAAGLTFYYCYKQITYVIVLYIILMIGVLILDTIIGNGLIKEYPSVEQQLKVSMDHEMSSYYSDPKAQTKWDTIQRDLKCCGTLTPIEWIIYSVDGNSIPSSCCTFNTTGPDQFNCVYSPDQFIVYQSGCYHKLIDSIDKPNRDHLLTYEVVVKALQLTNIVFATIITYAVYKRYNCPTQSTAMA